MKKIKAFFSKHWIGAWVGASVLYAFVIHYLYYKGTTIDFFVAKWSAGDILTYASTVSLGLLALWQNRKIQEENDVAQNRLEDIIKRNNELEVISKIIEHEERSINDFKELANEFITNCSVQSFGLSMSENMDEFWQNITELEQRIDKSYEAINGLVAYDSGITDILSLSDAIERMYEYTKNAISDIRSGSLNLWKNSGGVQFFKSDMMERGRDFEFAKDDYLSNKQNRLYSMLLNNVSLDDIRKMFNAELNE